MTTATTPKRREKQRQSNAYADFWAAIKVDHSAYSERRTLISFDEDDKPGPNKLNRQQLFANAAPEVRQAIEADIAFLDQELMGAYNRHSAASKESKAAYLNLQKEFAYAAAATIFISALQAGVIANVNSWVVVLIVGLAQAMLAFLTTWIAGRLRIRDPFKTWVASRRKVEALRREYFRFLMKLPPYDDASAQAEAKRKDLLITIVTDIDTEPEPDADNSASGNG